MTDKLRVLMIAPFPRALDKVVGGVEAATLSLVSALSTHERIDKVLVLAYDDTGEPETRTISDTLEVQYVRPAFLAGDQALQSVQLVPAARRTVARFRPDVVHGQGLGRQGRIAVALGLPVVVTVHGLINVEARMAARGLAGRIRAGFTDLSVKRVLDKAGVVVSISDYDARELAGLMSSPRVSIPNAVPAAFFEPSATAPRPDSILFAGVMRERKNVLGLVNAFSQVVAARPGARLQIAGPTIEPDYLARVQARIEALSLGGSVDFLGHVSTDRLVQAIGENTVLALFSFEETLPTIIAQALAMGRPAVASDVGGVGEMVIDGQTGWKVPSGDEAALAARLLETLSDPEAAAKMGRAGAELARSRFAPGAVADQTVLAYDRAIGSA